MMDYAQVGDREPKVTHRLQQAVGVGGQDATFRNEEV